MQVSHKESSQHSFVASYDFMSLAILCRLDEIKGIFIDKFSLLLLLLAPLLYLPSGFVAIRNVMSNEIHKALRLTTVTSPYDTYQPLRRRNTPPSLLLQRNNKLNKNKLTPTPKLQFVCFQKKKQNTILQGAKVPSQSHGFVWQLRYATAPARAGFQTVSRADDKGQPISSYLNLLSSPLSSSL